MEIIIIILLAVILISILALVWRQIKIGDASNNKNDGEAMSLLLQQMNQLSKVVDDKMGETTKSVGESVKFQFGESQKLMKEINERMTKELLGVTRGMTEANETGKQVLTIAEQLRSLEKVLKHQKQRGTLGEASLELILSNILPPTSYKLQHSFSTGEKVDAVIITNDGLIPIDAKFSLDNYTRVTEETDEYKKADLEKEFKNDLKKRIDETSKYIKTDENTLPFAFMFIPAEGIYYDLLINEVGSVKVNTRNLIDYAYNEKKVIIVSPTTFAAYLQSVLYGFKAFKIQEETKEIVKRVGELGKHLSAYEQYVTSLGRSLETSVNHYNKASKSFKMIDKDVLKIYGGESMVNETLSIEKPNRGEDE